jgi:hypothetical protein
MMPILKPAVVAIVIALELGLVHAQTVSVKVLNEIGLGIESNVYYEAEKPPARWQLTDKNGITSVVGKCPTISSFRARPLDIGAYFESNPQPCSTNVVLRVLSKKTPRGIAFKALNYQFALPDGTQVVGVVKFDVAPIAENNTSKAQCDVFLKTVTQDNFYQVVGDYWKEIDKSTIEPSAALTAQSMEAAMAPSLKNSLVSLPYSCENARSRITTLKAGREQDLLAEFKAPKWGSIYRQLPEVRFSPD